VLLPTFAIAAAWRRLVSRRALACAAACALVLAPWLARNALVHGKAMLGNELAFTFYWMKPIGKLKDVREAWLALPDHKTRQEEGARAAREMFAGYPERFFKPVPGRTRMMLGWESFISKFLGASRRFYPSMSERGNEALAVSCSWFPRAATRSAIVGLVLLQRRARQARVLVFLLLFLLPCIFLGAHTRYRSPGCRPPRRMAAAA
jgi:4-amino-4-deoxy-L-arabinose transferase-like glycosyltransferase